VQFTVVCSIGRFCTFCSWWRVQESKMKLQSFRCDKPKYSVHDDPHETFPKCAITTKYISLNSKDYNCRRTVSLRLEYISDRRDGNTNYKCSNFPAHSMRYASI